MAELGKGITELKGKYPTLEVEKVSVESELDKQQDNILLMLGETFN